MSEPSVSRARLENIYIFIKIDGVVTGTKPVHSINRSAAKSPSLPGAPGSPDRLARFTTRGIPPERVTGNSSKKLPSCHPKKPDISERPTRAPAQARQQLYAQGDFAEIGALWQRPAQRRGGQLHRKPGAFGCGARFARPSWRKECWR
jgi:hypothetical protein